MGNSGKKPAPNSTGGARAKGGGGAGKGGGRKAAPREVAPGRKVQAKQKRGNVPEPVPQPLCCGLDLSALPSGTLLYVEDGALTPISPPGYVGYLAFDPSRPGGAPYWERA
jgi:hypothetical protein